VVDGERPLKIPPEIVFHRKFTIRPVILSKGLPQKQRQDEALIHRK
jgi:hypothetical protein